MDTGLDANNFNEKGLLTLTLGELTNFYQLSEYVEIDEYLQTCKVMKKLSRAYYAKVDIIYV